MDSAWAFLKSKPIGRQIYVDPPLFAENAPETRWGLLKHRYGLATASREWYDTLMPPYSKIRRQSDITGKVGIPLGRRAISIWLRKRHKR